MKNQCSKAYAIRGRIPAESGRCLSKSLGHLSTSSVVLGRDVRRDGPALAAAVCLGLNEGGPTSSTSACAVPRRYISGPRALVSAAG